MSGVFHKRTIMIVIAVVAVSLIATVALTVLGDDLGEEQSAGVDGYSVSAIGHQGMVALLRKLDVPVIVSRSDSATKAQHGLLVLAEPTVTDQATRERFAALTRSAPRILLVLPKWYGQVERGKEWIADASFVPIEEIEPLFTALDLDAQIRRDATPSTFTGDDLVAAPAIREPQVIDSEHLTPLITDPMGGILVGELELAGRTVWILSDPDVLNNYGLRTQANARFSVSLIDRLRAGGPVVLDETLHGYAQQPSLVRTLFRFPLLLATLQVLVCALLAVWAAMVRFGPRKAAPPPIAPGKDFLIRNTAALLHYCGHHAEALRRYLILTVAEVRHRLHAPSLPPTQMTAWLEKIRERRGGKVSLLELEKSVTTADTPQRVVEVADQVYRWRMEMTDGSDRRT